MLRSDDDQSLRDTELDIRDALIDIATYLGEIVSLLKKRSAKGWGEDEISITKDINNINTKDINNTNTNITKDINK